MCSLQVLRVSVLVSEEVVTIVIPAEDMNKPLEEVIPELRGTFPEGSLAEEFEIHDLPSDNLISAVADSVEQAGGHSLIEERLRNRAIFRSWMLHKARLLTDTGIIATSQPVPDTYRLEDLIEDIKYVGERLGSQQRIRVLYGKADGPLALEWEKGSVRDTSPLN
ncbi:hypothetical protein CMI47_20160 [Candidatus Pacearchaeota archaeon]|nr:hypothetical protein [Candidatus Pacearchaeota archaeon]|tara:strand:- start:317 stop:811 length:495 start_codon:yes stop_codon:yes gene_type:complete